MQAWLFRRGEWQELSATQDTPAALRLARTPQMLTSDGAVNLYVGLPDARFPYVIGLRIGHAESARHEWVCVPDLPSLLQLMQQLSPWLRNEAAIQSFVSTMLDERLGPPPDAQPGSTGNARDLTAMNNALFDDAEIAGDLDRTLQTLAGGVLDGGIAVEKMVRQLTSMRSEITAEGDPIATRFDAVLMLLQSASLLLQSGERDGAIGEVKKALAAWKLDENEPLLP